MKKLILTLILFTLILLFSCQVPKEYTVTFDANGGTTVETQIIKEGKKVTKPQDPTKEGYTFLGWHSTDKKWSFEDDTVKDNIILKAEWKKIETHKVDFYLDGNDETPFATRTVADGEKITDFPIPETKQFLGWYNYYDEEYKNEITKDTVITSGMFLIARYKDEKVTVTFDANGGYLEESTREITKEKPFYYLPIPRKQGYLFVGWFDISDTSFEKKIKETDLATHDTTFIAKWELDVRSVTVEFIAPNSTLDEKDAYRYLQKGDRIGTLPTPTKKNYVLDYWKNDLTGEKITANTIISTNITCVAVWKKAVLCVNGTTNHTWSNWSLDYMERSRTCIECASSESITLENVTSDALGDSNPIIKGDVWGAENANKLVNGVIESSVSGLVSCKGTSSVTITLELKSPMELNMIYVSGMGSSTYSVSVTLDDNSTKYLGRGEFGQICGFDVENNTVIKVVITMSNSSSQGTDVWQEIILAQKA